jgi:hypothetical protein
MIAKGMTKLAISIIGGVGSILLFLGAFYFASTGKANFAILGVLLYIIGEAGGLYLTKYESQKEIEMFKLNFWQMIGGAYAFPILLLGLYFISGDKFLLIFNLAISAGAIIRTVAILAKAAYIEKNM